MITLLNLLAQSAPAASQPVTTGSGGGSIFSSPLVPLVLMIVVFWFIMSRGRGKERKKYEQMLNALKRNDRVQTIGGIIGTVVEVRDDEVIIKIDESTNTKMRFVRSAIKGVVEESPATEAKR